MEPDNYDNVVVERGDSVSLDLYSTTQRVVPIDQPGLNLDEHVYEPKSPRLELKKYVSADPEAAVDDAFSDAQDEGKSGAETVEVEPSSSMTIKYVVTNLGDVDLENVRITDIVTSGGSRDTIQQAIDEKLAVIPALSLAVGEAKAVTLRIPTPAGGGSSHRDVAQASGGVCGRTASECGVQ